MPVGARPRGGRHAGHHGHDRRLRPDQGALARRAVVEPVHLREPRARAPAGAAGVREAARHGGQAPGAQLPLPRLRAGGRGRGPRGQPAPPRGRSRTALGRRARPGGPGPGPGRGRNPGAAARREPPAFSGRLHHAPEAGARRPGGHRPHRERLRREVDGPPAGPTGPDAQDRERLLEGLARLGRGSTAWNAWTERTAPARAARTTGPAGGGHARRTGHHARPADPGRGPGRGPETPGRPRRRCPRHPGGRRSLERPAAPQPSGIPEARGLLGEETLPGMRAALAALAEAAAPGPAPQDTPAPHAAAPEAPARRPQGRACWSARPRPCATCWPRCSTRPAAPGGRASARPERRGPLRGLQPGPRVLDAPGARPGARGGPAGATPVVMLRGFRRAPDQEPDLSGLPVTVLYKPFQVQALYAPSVRPPARARSRTARAAPTPHPAPPARRPRPTPRRLCRRGPAAGSPPWE